MAFAPSLLQKLSYGSCFFPEGQRDSALMSMDSNFKLKSVEISLQSLTEKLAQSTRPTATLHVKANSDSPSTEQCHTMMGTRQPVVCQRCISDSKILVTRSYCHWQPLAVSMRLQYTCSQCKTCRFTKLLELVRSQRLRQSLHDRDVAMQVYILCVLPSYLGLPLVSCRVRNFVISVGPAGSASLTQR